MTDYEKDIFEENEYPDFDVEVNPTEYECNDCGWRGCPSSTVTFFGNGTQREDLYCPRCRKGREVSEWKIVSADPYQDQPEADEEQRPLAPVANVITIATAETVVQNPEDMRGIDTALLTLIQELQRRVAELETQRKPAGRQQGKRFEGAA